MSEQQTPSQQMRTAYEKSEKQLSRAAEELVSSQGFAESLAMLTSNAVALTRVVNIGLDQMVRATRFAGQRDIVRLGRQLNRTEDKLEQVLQIVEQLEDELAATRAERDEARAATTQNAAENNGQSSARTRGRSNAAKKSSARSRSASVTLDAGEEIQQIEDAKLAQESDR
ncbi:MAG: hypothetical protein Q4G43_03960 [Mobilicoccus sp.]|nr:hypothetical protein [Mobilicoccus sp.]